MLATAREQSRAFSFLRSLRPFSIGDLIMPVVYRILLAGRPPRGSCTSGRGQAAALTRRREAAGGRTVQALRCKGDTTR